MVKTHKVHAVLCLAAWLTCLSVAAGAEEAGTDQTVVMAGGGEATTRPGDTQPAPGEDLAAGDETPLAGEGGELLLWQNIPVVVTASRKAEPIDVAPNVMYVVTREEIRKYGYKTVQDILHARIPNFFSLFSQNIQQHLFQVRGASFGENIKIAWMINGHRINNVNEDSSAVLPMTLDKAERVEVIVGPGSVLYGADTLLATVNIITRDLEGFELSYTIGFGEFCRKLSASDDDQVTALTHIGSVMWGHKWADDKKVFVSATYARKDGWRTFLNGNRALPDARPQDLLRPSYNLFASGQYGDWYVQYHRLVQDIGRMPTVRSSNVDSIVVRYKPQFTEKLSGNFEFSLDERRMIRRPQYYWRQVLYKGEAGIRYKTDKHDFQAGIQTAFGDNRGNYERIAGGPAVHDKVSTIIGGYITDEYKVNDKLSLVGALRVDHSNVTQKHRCHMSPRAAVIYRPTEKWTLKAMYNSAIQFPDPAHSELAILFNSDRGYTGWSAGHLAEKPERMQAWEVQSIHYIGKSRLAVNFFYQKINDVIAWVKPWQNMADLSGFGVELDFKYPVCDKLNVWANASYQNTGIDLRSTAAAYTGIKYATPDEKVSGVPWYSAAAGFDYKLTKDITVTSTVRYLSDLHYQRQWWSKSGSERDAWDMVRHQFYVDFSLLWENFLYEDLDLRITGTNILNNRHLLPRQREKGDYAPEGISLFATVTYSWK
jgi:iron complex outermembrane receptor protein